AGAAAVMIGYERPLAAGAAALGIVAVLIGGEFAVFRVAGWLVDGIYAGASGLLTFGVMLTEHLRAAQAERRRLDAELADQRERNARLAGELEAARAIQMGLLPRLVPASADRGGELCQRRPRRAVSRAAGREAAPPRHRWWAAARRPRAVLVPDRP